MTGAVVHWLETDSSPAFSLGQALMELTIDLSASYGHDCPPISYFRVVLREKVWLRERRFADGAEAMVGDVIALFTTSPDEALDGPPMREVRSMLASVIPRTKDDLW